MPDASPWLRTSLAGLAFIAALTLPAACAATPTPLPPLTVTFRDGGCAYDGPSRLPLGAVTMNLKDDGRGAYSQYAVFAATIDPGKTLDDLKAIPVEPRPDWVHEVIIWGPLPAGATDTFTTDLREGLSELKGGPIYLLCFTRQPLTRVGLVGLQVAK